MNPSMQVDSLLPLQAQMELPAGSSSFSPQGTELPQRVSLLLDFGPHAPLLFGWFSVCLPAGELVPLGWG